METENKDPMMENPLRKVEAFYDELLAHYGPGEDREIRAAAKLLLVALDKFRRHGGQDWMSLVTEYITISGNLNSRYHFCRIIG